MTNPQDKLREEFDKTFTFDGSGESTICCGGDYCDGMHSHELEAIKELWSWITTVYRPRVLEEMRSRLLNSIIYKMETMVFDDTSKDRLGNIIKFRNAQSDYLRGLLTEKKHETE